GDLAPVFGAMLDKAMRLCGAAFGILRTYDGQRFNASAARGVPPRFAEFLASNPQDPQPGTMGFQLLETKAVVHVADVMDREVYRSGDIHARALVDLGGARTSLSVPLLKDGAVLGAVQIYRQHAQPFTDKQIALLQNFADQAVIAIENARLITETREALEQQTATSEVLKVINASPGDLAPVFDTILKKAHSLCDVEMGSLQLRDGEKFRAVAVHGLSAAWTDQVRQGYRLGPNHPIRPLLEGASFAQVPDLGEIDDPACRAVAELAGVRTGLFIPLRKDDRLLGVITAARLEVKLFTEKEIALLESFAAQAVIAIENARLINETREALEQQTATAEVLQVINASPGDLAPVFDSMLANALRICEAKFGCLSRFGATGSEVVAMMNVPPAFASWLREPRPGPGGPVLERMADAKQVVHVADLASERAYLDRLPARVAAVELGGVRTMLAVP